MKKFLDEIGLLAVWNKIENRFLKIKDYIDKNRIKGVSKEEFDRMSDEEKKGLVVVTDDDSPSLSQSGEVYSEEETVIGMWFGKPLYRRTFKITSVSATNTSEVLSITIDNCSEICNFWGFINISGSNARYPLNYGDASNYVMTWISTQAGKFAQRIVGTGLTNRPMTMTVEYTKTTD